MTTTQIKAVEIWTPDAEGQLLELKDGLYGGAKAFETLSRGMCFGRGEGLPGRVWELGRPVLMKDLQAGYFRRAAAARKAGLAAAVALPVFAGEALKAVLVLFCGDAEAESGAIELWRNDPRVTTDMTLVDGYYGAAEALAAASSDTYIPRGAGLPGLAWQRQASVFMEDLGDGSRFVRHEAALAAGVRRGLAIPCPLPTRENFAVAFLSTTERPVPCRWARWGRAGVGLQRGFGFCEAEGALSAGGTVDSADSADPTLLAALRSGAPQLRQADPVSAMLALPIHGEEGVSEVLALYF
jgi:hypothetical protein